MEKFEKILSTFIKNPYTNIELSDEYETKKNKFIFGILIVNLISIFFNGISILIIDEFTSNTSINYIIIYLYFFILLFSSIISIYLIKNFYKYVYKQVYFLLYSLFILYIYFISIFLSILSLLFTIDTIETITVYIYYVTFILLCIFYRYYYYRKWKRYIIENHLKKIIIKLKDTSYNIDSDEKFFKFDLKEEKNKPKLTKIAEIVVSLMIRFGFTIPVLAVLASNGVGENGMIYFAIYLMFFIIPEVMKVIVRQSALYSILKQIEKEENVTIYNGKLKTLDSENK